ncbi:hypothetical protein [Paenibacillus larvae]|uniref:hypothetical protein n=1 Tax=Paenibacillus larvae TaxID=1464 RepID=UPI001181CAB1|nr:hypothetical protein [Paenibacillus larvae]MDR5568102.1 hypothetical protein [Paenibacillus larvae]
MARGTKIHVETAYCIDYRPEKFFKRYKMKENAEHICPFSYAGRNKDEGKSGIQSTKRDQVQICV